jgi:hypothetical protein
VLLALGTGDGANTSSTIKTFNDKNEEMEEEEYRIAQLKNGGLMNAPSRRKSKPLPPYWGSGFNRQIIEDDVSLCCLHMI